MKKTNFWLRGLAASVYLVLLKAGTALATAPTTAPTTTTGGAGWNSGGSFSGMFKQVYDFAVGLAGVIFVVMFLVGGIQYLTSMGNPESSEKAKKLLINAVIGLIIVVIAYTGGSWIISQVGGEKAF